HINLRPHGSHPRPAVPSTHARTPRATLTAAPSAYPERALVFGPIEVVAEYADRILLDSLLCLVALLCHGLAVVRLLSRGVACLRRARMADDEVAGVLV